MVEAVAAPQETNGATSSALTTTHVHLKMDLGPDDYTLSVIRLMDKVEHVASKSELARAGRGYAVPK